jgi:hypothetical protein
MWPVTLSPLKQGSEKLEMVENYATFYLEKPENEIRTQNYRVFGLFYRPVFLGVETRRFGNWICFILR